MQYYQRIKDLRTDKEASQSTVANELNTTQQQYSKYEKGIQPIQVKHIIALAKYYHVPTDYILGLTDVTTPYPPRKTHKD